MIERLSRKPKTIESIDSTPKKFSMVQQTVKINFEETFSFVTFSIVKTLLQFYFYLGTTIAIVVQYFV